jgi:hypothetical protein
MGGDAGRRRELRSKSTGEHMVKTGRIIMGVIALAIALVFFAIPVIKIKDVAMTIIILIGVVAMIVSFVESVKEKDDA